MIAGTMQCNIDTKGRLVRMIYGVILLIGGAAMLFFWALPGGSVLGWVISIASIVAGAFTIFESLAGWCIVRATGFKTSI